MKYPVLLMSFALISCSVKKNMDDMHNLTKKMSEDVEKTGATSENINGITSTTYTTLRQGDTKNSRAHDMKELNSDKSFKLKIIDAGHYYKGLEFNFWSPKDNPKDTKENREYMFQSSIKEMFTMVGANIEELMAKAMSATDGQAKLFGLGEYSPLDALFDGFDSQRATLYALALTMHVTNEHQEINAQKNGYEIESMKSLMVRSLENLQKYNAGLIGGDEVKPHQEMLLDSYDKAAKILLKLRGDVMLTFALDKVVPGIIKYASLYNEGPEAEEKQAILEAGLDHNFDKLNVFAQKKVLSYLMAAIEVQKLTKLTGKEYGLSQELLKIVSSIKLDREMSSMGEGAGSEAKARNEAQKAKFKILINMLSGRDQAPAAPQVEEMIEAGAADLDEDTLSGDAS
ncbi:MAG: hypothetical protein ACPGJV_04465 [Bacteriovoracaceae bacterium]